MFFLQKAPKDQLLVYKMGDGWEPLCKFLNKVVPVTEFPHKNKNATFYEDVMNSHPVMIKMRREATISILFLSAVVAICSYKLTKKCITG